MVSLIALAIYNRIPMRCAHDQIRLKSEGVPSTSSDITACLFCISIILGESFECAE